MENMGTYERLLVRADELIDGDWVVQIGRGENARPEDATYTVDPEDGSPFLSIHVAGYSDALDLDPADTEYLVFRRIDDALAQDAFDLLDAYHDQFDRYPNDEDDGSPASQRTEEAPTT